MTQTAPPPRSPGHSVPGAEPLRIFAVVLLSVWPALVGMVSPHDLEANDQGRAAMCVLAALNGDWLVPSDRGAAPSKPPLQTWLAALAAREWGLDEYTVRLPSVAASFAASRSAVASVDSSVGIRRMMSSMRPR